MKKELILEPMGNALIMALVVWVIAQATGAGIGMGWFLGGACLAVGIGYTVYLNCKARRKERTVSEVSIPHRKVISQDWIIGGVAFIVVCVLVSCILFIPLNVVSLYRIDTPSQSQLERLEQGYNGNVEWMGIKEDTKFAGTSIIQIRIRTSALTVHTVSDYFNESGIGEHKEFIQNTEIGPF